MKKKELPEPLTPAGTDLRKGYDWMPLMVQNLRGSKNWLIAKRAAEKCPEAAIGFFMVSLWAAAWHEVPAGSLPDDDDVLADKAGCPMSAWSSVKELSMRGFVLCRDGRWYHPTVCKMVDNVLDNNKKNRKRSEAARKAKAEKRAQKSLSQNCDSSAASLSQDQIRTEQIRTEQIRTDGERDGNKKDDPPSGDSSPAATPAAEASPDLLADDQEDRLDIPVMLDRTTAGEAVRRWNAMAGRVGLPLVQKITKARRSKLMARLRDCGGLTGWEAALSKVEASSFLRGERSGRDHEGFRADIDFLLQESSFVKLMEGRYDDRPGSPGGGRPRQDEHRNGYAALMDEGRP